MEAVAIVLGACVLSLIYKPDNNWDLRSYHIYNPFAFLDGRLSRDLYVAGSQTYFNPLLDVPYFVLSVRLLPAFPRLVAFLSGIPLGMLSLIVLRLARLTLPPTLRRRNWFAIGAAVLGLTGTATISEIGTTFGDIPVAILVLGGLTLALSRRDRIGAASMAGLLAGLAAGLKPVACVFAPGLALGLALIAGGPRRFLMTGFAVTLSWIAGFAIAFGPWGLTVEHLFGNPVFPLLNHIFESPWFPPVSGTDDRFLPKDIWQFLFFPFYWLRGRPFVVAELNVRDPRFALVFISLFVILFHAIWKRSDIIGKPAAALCVFFATSFVLWEAMFAILRYALALEAVSGIVMMLALLIVVGGLPRDDKAERRLLAMAGAALIVVFAVSSRPGWGRLRAYGDAVFDVQAPPIADHSAVVFVDRPMAFLAPFLKGNDLLFVGIESVPVPSRLSEEITRRIQSRPAIMAVVRGSPDQYDSLTPMFGFRILKPLCAPIVSANQRDLSLCPGQASTSESIR